MLKTTNRLSTLFSAIILSMLPPLASADDAANTDALEEFQVHLVARYIGFSADVWTHLSATENADEYVYEVTTKARGLAKLVRSGTASEKSIFTLTDIGLRPISYHLDDGTKKVENDTDITFDWDAGIARSVYKEEAKDFELTAGMLDRLTADIAAMQKLRSAEEPGSYTLIHRNSIREYGYTSEGKEKISVDAGEFAAVKYKYQRPGSTRHTIIWFAPELGFLPVKAEQFKRGKSQVTMEAASIQRGASGPSPVSQ